MSVANHEEGDTLQYSEFHHFFDLSPDHFAISAPDGHFKRLNPTWEKVSGYSIDELLHTPVRDLIHPDDVPATTAAFESLIDGRPSVTFENRYRCKDGSYRWLEWTAYYHDQSGLIYSVARDITERKHGDAILRESEARFRTIADAAPIFIWMSDQNKDTVYFNQSWLQFRQVPIEQELGKGWMKGLHPDDAERAWQIYADAFDARQTFVMEYRLQGADGEYRWFLSSGALRFTPDGEFLGYVGTCVDIHDRILAETALRQSEHTLRDLLNGSQDIAFLTDTNGYLLTFNTRFAELFGKTSAEFVGGNYFDWLPPDATLARRASAETVIQTQTDVREEIELLGRVWDYTIHPIVDVKGQVVSLARFGHDITHRKRTEQKLRQSEEQFRNVLESAVEGILLTDSTGAILLVNRQIEVMFGYTREELFGQSVDMLLPEARRDRHAQYRADYLAHPRVRLLDIRQALFAQRKDGTIFPTEISLSYMSGAGDEILVMAFVTDITDRKAMEQAHLDYQRQQLELQQQREIVELRQKFMSMVSHEFRTPLTVISTSCEMLLHYYDRLTREKQMEKLQLINAQVRSMVSLLDDILALSKIQAGAAEFVPEPLDLQALCAGILDNIKIVDQGQHAFTFIFDDIPPTIQADRRLLEHIITNLLSNAVKYSPENTTIFFSLLGGKDGVALEIRDQGIGIPPEDQSHLFEPFYRARNARQVSGTGLGLAIVKHNVEQHGGSITCHSTEGEGATFSIHLPTGIGA